MLDLCGSLSPKWPNSSSFHVPMTITIKFLGISYSDSEFSHIIWFGQWTLENVNTSRESNVCMTGFSTSQRYPWEQFEASLLDNESLSSFQMRLLDLPAASQPLDTWTSPTRKSRDARWPTADCRQVYQHSQVS